MSITDQPENENPFLKGMEGQGDPEPSAAVDRSKRGQVRGATVKAMALGDRAGGEEVTGSGALVQASTVPSDGGRMEAVVDLLFGNHLKEINDSMRALEKQVTERVTKAEAEMGVRIDSIDRHTRREVDTLNKLLEKERSARLDAVSTLNDRIDAAIRQIEVRLEKMEGEITRRHEAAQQDVDERMVAAADTTSRLRQEMESEIAGMKRTLSTRAELSGMFAELGKRLGGSGVDGELG